MSAFAEDLNVLVVEDDEVAVKAGSCRPLIKWAGGKGKLLPQLLSRMPANMETYFEPMIGGGALFFAQRPERAVLGDLNSDLIGMYRVVQQKPDLLIETLKKFKHSRKLFYKVRNADRDASYWSWSDVERAARLIYLNRTCFNGLYRVNSRGQFNVPYGDYKNPRIVDAENIQACSQALQGVVLEAGSFERIVERARKGDFVYFDPPYFPLSSTSNFTSYVSGGFTEDDQIKLRTICAELDDAGVKWMVSNSHSEVMLRLWSGFRIDVVESARAINSDGGKRGKVREVIIRNYSR